MKPANRIAAKQVRREGRKLRVRKKVIGTPERPRLAIFRSNRYIYAQIIDDQSGTTLAAAQTGNGTKSAKSIEAASELGKKIAAVAQAKGITTVVFDKGWYRYHGRVKAVADAAREAGLVF